MAIIFNPIADRIIEEIELNKGKITRIRPGTKAPLGKLLVFRYMPKYKSVLPYYDTFPASVVIGRYSDGFLGIATHYLPWSVRLNLAERMLRATKNNNRITYPKILKAVAGLQLPIGYAKFIIKRYLFSHITSSNIFVFDFENYKKFLTDTKPSFRKKSDMIVYKATIKAFNDHAKTQKDKKTKWTNKSKSSKIFK